MLGQWQQRPITIAKRDELNFSLDSLPALGDTHAKALSSKTTQAYPPAVVNVLHYVKPDR
jgi:hypothetical protein